MMYKLIEAIEIAEKEDAFERMNGGHLALLVHAARSTLTPPDTQGALDKALFIVRTLRSLWEVYHPNDERAETSFKEIEQALRAALSGPNREKELLERIEVLKQSNALLIKEGRKNPVLWGRCVENNGRGETIITDTVYIGEPEMKTIADNLIKKVAELEAIIESRG